MRPIPWFKVDDKLHDHRKARAARKAAMGVWVLAGSWCADNLMDGFVPASVLNRWGTTRDAATLVAVGLWHPDNAGGEDGWRFHDWANFQPTKAKVEAEREAKAEAGRKGGVKSGASRREARAKQGASPLVELPSRPVPTPTSTGRSSQSQTDPSSSVDDDGLTRIQELTKGTKTHARKCVEFVLSKTSNDIKNPTAYVLKAIREDPDAYRYKRGNPKKGEECPTHAGQWADACAGCAADLKASK